MVRIRSPSRRVTGSLRTSLRPKSTCASDLTFFGLPFGFPELPLANRPFSRAGIGAFSLAFDMCCSRQAATRSRDGALAFALTKMPLRGLSGALRGVAPLSRRYLEKYRIALASWRLSRLTRPSASHVRRSGNTHFACERNFAFALDEPGGAVAPPGHSHAAALSPIGAASPSRSAPAPKVSPVSASVAFLPVRASQRLIVTST